MIFTDTRSDTPLAGYLLHMMEGAWICMVINSDSQKGEQWFYLRGEDIVYVCEQGERIRLIPSFPLLVGALADALEEEQGELLCIVNGEERIHLDRRGSDVVIRNMEEQILFCGRKETEWINWLAVYLLEELKKIWEEENGAVSDQ